MPSENYSCSVLFFTRIIISNPLFAWGLPIFWRGDELPVPSWLHGHTRPPHLAGMASRAVRGAPMGDRPAGLQLAPLTMGVSPHGAFNLHSCGVCLFAMQRFVFAMPRLPFRHVAFCFRHAAFFLSPCSVLSFLMGCLSPHRVSCQTSRLCQLFPSFADMPDLDDG